MADSSSRLASEPPPQDIPSTIQNAGSDAFSPKRDAILAVYKDVYIIQ